MGKLVRLDASGHSELAEWTVSDQHAYERARSEFRRQLELGYIGTVPEAPGRALHVRELPRDAELVIMRRPIAGG
ncbi:hypothetical protein [Thermoleophilum album]|uniref:Uncharacterized protein n=1 Tax=Thermoleophilum album TaxID=29539 RepID=A0A1H6FVV2_THEAL|nr:hypothetical protein [Thermoleophilum album]SEH14926.1 hypothetical protein SAMN02745716_1784 [Thermoleophilum album]